MNRGTDMIEYSPSLSSRDTLHFVGIRVLLRVAPRAVGRASVPSAVPRPGGSTRRVRRDLSGPPTTG
jgi:hypothetical protein